ncbi:MAG: M48 family metalloprotease, partial [Actinomycetota bacterium]|nr:M48 family metalloprotease [Actinomycetota bacterium]
AWVLILAVSVATLVAAVLLRRLIKRPGGLAAGLLLGIPLVLPLIAALIYEHGVLPEIAILRPARAGLLAHPSSLLHLFFLADPDSHSFHLYALTGSAGPWLLLIGLSVSSFMLLRRAVGGVLVHRLIARSAVANDDRLLDAIEQLADRAAIATPEVRVLPDGVSGAFAVGAFRGRILLSRDLLDELDDEELDAILAHEIAHLQAHDVHLVFAAGMLRDMVAWNPFAHIAFRRLQADRELEADRRAAEMTGSPLAVASGLVRVCEVLTGKERAATPTLAALHPRARVSRRVDRLLALADRQPGFAFATPTTSRWGRSTGRLPYLVAAALVAVLGLQVAARVAHENPAGLAFVWGAPDASSNAVWNPQEARPLPSLPRAHGHIVKQHLVPARLARLANDPMFLGNLSVRQKDVPRYLHRMMKLAHLMGLPTEVLRGELRYSDWKAVPLLQHPLGGVLPGIYGLRAALDS